MRAALFLTAALSLSSVVQAQPASRPSAVPNAQESVPQTGSKADQLRENLKKIKLPPGFKIELYAVVPDARQMAVGNKAGIVFVGTTKDEVWAVTSHTQARVAKVVEAMAPSVTMNNPNGVCTSKDGVLYVVEDNRVLAFPNAKSSYGRPDAAFQQVYDRLVPPTEISHNHGARVCRVGPDNKLYITLGQPSSSTGLEAGTLQPVGHGRHHPHEPRRQEPRNVRGRNSQLSRYRLQSAHRRTVVHRQPGGRHGRRPAA